MFEELYSHEIFVSDAINSLVHIAFLKKITPHTTSFNGMFPNRLRKKHKPNLFLIK